MRNGQHPKKKANNKKFIMGRHRFLCFFIFSRNTERIHKNRLKRWEKITQSLKMIGYGCSQIKIQRVFVNKKQTSFSDNKMRLLEEHYFLYTFITLMLGRLAFDLKNCWWFLFGLRDSYDFT